MRWSDEAYRIFGYTRETVPSFEAILAHTPANDLALVRGAFLTSHCGVQLIDIDHRLAMPNGNTKYVHYVAYLTTKQPGKPEYVGALMDVA
jgi:hypothetical protein